jgi:hypothetical protein
MVEGRIAMNVEYRQCHLEQPQGRATLHHTAWLPATFANVGATVRLLGSDGTWSPPWKVTFASQARLPEHAVRKAERAHLKQRKASDI